MNDQLPIFEQAWKATHTPPPGGRHRWASAQPPPPLPTMTQETTLSNTPVPDQPPYIRRPRSAQPASLTAQQVAKAYNLPSGYDGTGVTVGIIELGGAFSTADLKAAGVGSVSVTPVGVDGGSQQSDPQGADGEVALDIQVIAEVAPGAKQRVYFAANSDQGFLDAIKQAANECDFVSISWGSAESQWSKTSIKAFAAEFAAARAKGVTVFVAAGDSGSKDSTSSNVTDYPASDPNVVGCGGTRLTLNSDGTRASEVVWDDDPNSSATGGGVSKVFPGRSVPDVAGNADPESGYPIWVDGQEGVIGGTSAVAPLMAGMSAVIKQASGGKSWDWLNLLATNPGVCVDIVSGGNGGYRAGPGRDDVSGYGVPDAGKILAILTSGTQVPAPGGGTTGTGGTGGGTTPPTSTETPGATALLKAIQADIAKLLGTA